MAPMTFIANASDGLLETFGVQWQLLLIQGINFLCVVAVLYFFAFRPVLKKMEERKSKIEQGLQFAEDIKKQLASTEAVVQQKILESREGARKILEEAKSQANDYLSQEKVKTEQMARNMIESAKVTMLEEKNEMMADLKREVKGLALDVVSKVLTSTMTDVDLEKYNQSLNSHRL